MVTLSLKFAFKMISKFLFIIICFLAFSGLIHAQVEKKAISEVIEMYFDGWASSDTSKVSKSMHPSCHLKYFREGQFADISKSEYLSKFGKPKQRESSIETKIEAIDFTGNIAQAKTVIKTEKATFIDYFNLIKTDIGWFIVDKVSVRF